MLSFSLSKLGYVVIMEDYCCYARLRDYFYYFLHLWNIIEMLWLYKINNNCFELLVEQRKSSKEMKSLWNVVVCLAKQELVLI